MSEDKRIKGMGDIRTMSTHHIASRPPRKGTTYLDLFALSMEKQRLEQELAGLERRRKRILTRLGEAEASMQKILCDIDREKDASDAAQAGNGAADQTSAGPAAPASRGAGPGGRPVRKISMEY